ILLPEPLRKNVSQGLWRLGVLCLWTIRLRRGSRSSNRRRSSSHLIDRTDNFSSDVLRQFHLHILRSTTPNDPSLQERPSRRSDEVDAQTCRNAEEQNPHRHCHEHHHLLSHCRLFISRLWHQNLLLN